MMAILLMEYVGAGFPFRNTLYLSLIHFGLFAVFWGYSINQIEKQGRGAPFLHDPPRQMR